MKKNYLQSHFQILLYINPTESQVLRPFVQKHGLRLSKLTGKATFNALAKGPLFTRNANYIIYSHQFVSPETCFSVSQFLVSKATVLSFVYKGHMLNNARLKLLSKLLPQSWFSGESYPIWKYLRHYHF